MHVSTTTQQSESSRQVQLAATGASATTSWAASVAEGEAQRRGFDPDLGGAQLGQQVERAQMLQA